MEPLTIANELASPSAHNVIWGGGMVGTQLCDYFLQNGYNVDFLVDNSNYLDNAKYRDITIHNAYYLKNVTGIEKYNFIIASVKSHVIDDILCDLANYGIKEDHIYDFRSLPFLLSDYKNSARTVRRKFGAQVHIVDQCNLNCRGCDHFSPISDNHFIDIEKYEQDIRRLLELFGDDFIEVSLLGGEPLLNPDIEKIVKLTRDILPKARIDIITNGILLKDMPESFWQTSKECNVVIKPTKYPIKAPYEWAENKAKTLGIQFEYMSSEPVKLLWKEALDIQGTEDKDCTFDHCGEANACVTLEDGKIYTCSVAAYVKHFEKYYNIKLKYSHTGGIDIYKAKDAEEIMRFIASPTDMCRHCNIMEKTYNNPWGISKKEIEEWT